MSRDFLFTVIIAACNAERTLPITVESIINQTFGFEYGIEVIIVNDGSSDATSDVAREYARLYPENIRVFDKGYGGTASARNVGLRMSTGEYINFCEAGGSFDEKVFAAVALFFESEGENTSLVALSSKKTRSTDEFFDVFKMTRVVELERTPTFYQPEVAAYFISRSVCALLSFDESLAEFSGTEFIYRILAKKDATVGVIEKLRYHAAKKPMPDIAMVKLLLNDYMPKILRYYRDRYDPPLPRYFLTMVMRMFCDVFAGLARQMNPPADERKKILAGMKPILSLMGENMLRGDRYITEDALAFCLSMKPAPQEFLKSNFPEFDSSFSVTAVIPVDGDEELLSSIRQSFCEKIDIIRSSRHAALQKATGDYIMFFEKDDRVDADLFRNMLRRLSLDRVSVCCCGYRDKSGRVFSPKGMAGVLTPAVAASASLPISTFMFKTSYLRSRVEVEDISSFNSYFYLAVLRKTELSIVDKPLLSCSYKEIRSIDQLFGDKTQRSADPLAACYDEYNSIKHFARLTFNNQK